MTPETLQTIQSGGEAAAFLLPILMAFPSKMRQFWMEVAAWKCMWEYYDEKYGFRECGRPAEEVHHIEGEAETLARGGDPNQNEGLPLCKTNHRKGKSGEEWGKNSSMHPDMALAEEAYPRWKSEKQRQLANGEIEKIDYKDAPYAVVAREHKAKISRGERYISGTEEIDRYYIEKMKRKEHEYYLRTGNRRPVVSPHPKYQPGKKKKWFGGLF